MAAACGSLQHIFENPLPENPTLLESLSSWNQIKPAKAIEQPSFTEIFGELHFKENSESSPCPVQVPPLSSSSDGSADRDGNRKTPSSAFSGASRTAYTSSHRNSDSFSSMSSDSLQLCTEGLGSESSDDVEDLANEIIEDRQHQEEKSSVKKHHLPYENQVGEVRRSRTIGGSFPPPISCISKSGKPWVCFKSYRQDGRFVLKEIRVPTREFLHACREDGRLKLHFVQPEDEIPEEDEEEEEEEEEGDEYGEEENEEKDTDNGKEEEQWRKTV